MPKPSYRVLACWLVLAGCSTSHSPQEELLFPAATLVDHRPDDESAANVRYLHGTYGPSCDEGSDSWTLAVDGTPHDHAPLSLAEHDDDCELIITSAETSDGEQLFPQTTVKLGVSYADLPVAFGAPPVFYASAKLDAQALQGTGELTFVIAERAPELVSYSATEQGASVSTPDYVLDIGGLTIETDVHDVVRAVRGSAALQSRTVRGVAYTLAAGRLTSYDALDAAYLAQHRALSPLIPGSEFNLLGVDLTTHPVRTLIVANVVNGVRAYQAITIRFDPLP